MRRNVVLFQPRVGDMDQFRDRPTPPLGLLCAASGLDPSIEVRFIDARLEREWRAKLRDALDASTIAVGVTALTGGMIANAADGARVVRETRDVPIVWGGVHASLLPRESAASGLVDYVVEGEGDFVFGALVERLRSGGAVDLPGVFYKEGGEVRGQPRGPLIDLPTLPPTPHHLVDMERYIGRYRDKRWFFYQSSRGCPFRCAYCYNNAFNRGRWRSLPVERVLSDVKDLRSRYEFSTVYFLDDDFFVNKKRAMTILRGLREMGLGCVLQGVDVQSISRMSDDELRFIEDAGVERISIGVESGVDRIRTDLLHKWGSIDIVREQLGRLRDRRFLVLLTFIIGFPTETVDDIRRTVDLALWALAEGQNFRIPQLYNFVPYPGTELYEYVRERGFPFPDDLEGWGRYEWDTNIMHGDDAAQRAYLERVVFLSKFLDRKLDDYGFGGPMLRAAYRAYRPLAWLRMQKDITRPLPERRVYDFLRKNMGVR